MDLGKHVVDNELLDRRGLRAGKVDDLLLEIPEPAADGALPEPRVVAIISGPLALSRNMPRWVFRLVRWLYHLAGVADPHPLETPWERVTAIDVTVHVDIDREHEEMMALQNAVNRRFLRRIPGA